MKRKGRAGKIIQITGIILAAAAATVILLMTILPMTETNRAGSRAYDASETADASCWMTALADDRLLSEINIPGAHDAASDHVMLGFFSKCQSTTIYEQLSDGFRYLDIRLAMTENGDELKLMHGFCECTNGVMPWSGTLMLDSVLEQCYRFLRENPGETILFCVKLEHGKRDFAAFQKVLQTYVQKDRDSWLLTDTMPTLGEARGKIVLLRRYSDYAGLGQEAGIDFYWTDQNGSTVPEMPYVVETKKDFLMTVQDRFELTKKDKWLIFRDAIDSATTDESLKGTAVVNLNFLSTKGTAKFGHPYAYSTHLNRRLLEEEYTQADKPGWVIMDFGNASLAKHIYRNN